MSNNTKTDFDTNNSDFWDTLCGTTLANYLGITDFSLRSLEIFDTFYMGYYPYLMNWIPFASIANKDVLEVGLGYGTTGQMLAASRCNYTGLDIAAAPVNLMNRRLELYNLPGKAIQGSILNSKLDDASYDIIITIGCLHHTGNIQQAIREISRLLKPNGKLIMMVYYAYSYRLWYHERIKMIPKLFKNLLGAAPDQGSKNIRTLYDSANDEAAPYTAFVAKQQLKKLASNAGLSVVKHRTENADQEAFFKNRPRDTILPSFWAKYFGLDLYATLVKN